MGANGMSIHRAESRPRAGVRRRLFVAIALAIPGCGDASEAPVVAIEAAPVAESTALEPPALAPVPVPSAPSTPPPAPPPPPPPAPDPEAIARAREEAERELFEREHPFHGVAYHFVAQVHQRPDASSPVVGYMRRGTKFRAQAPLRGPGCPRGWHRVQGGGFVCRGNGFALGSTPQSFEPSPVPPALEDALPYPYGWVAQNGTPLYWRLPTRDEERAVLEWIRAQHAASEAAGPAPTAQAEPEPNPEAPPGLDADLSEENAEAPTASAAPTTAALAPLDAGVAEPPSVLRMSMRRGFYVSIDRVETSEGRRFYRTVRGNYVPADAIVEASPPSTRGVVLGGRWALPMGFVYRDGVRTLRRDPARNVLELADPIERSTPLPLTDEIIERSGRRYRVSDRGRIVREDALRIATLTPRPPQVPEDARWIHVDLGAQVLVAYEGDRPVFATLVSTGREGYETPTGLFRIQSKHVSTTMDDTNAGDESYSIEDVPWTMYFEGSYAIHGAFWHDRFGRPRSHGCVNLAPADARWIFQWTEPALPPGWHGMSSPRGQGTYVYITAGSAR